MNRYEPLHKYMEERHKIYRVRKEGVEPPYSDDEIFQKYRFCNVFRELDTVTIWINENIRKPFADHSMLWFMLAVARQINHPETLAELLNNGNHYSSWYLPENMTEVLLTRQDRGEKIYTGAYMIRGENNKDVEWYKWRKVKYTSEIVLGNLYKDRDNITKKLESISSLQEAHKLFMNYRAWGHFLSYELVTDLRHTHYLENATDIMTWANAGPGAIRGLNRLHDRKLNYVPKGEITNQEMVDALTELNPLWFGELEMRDIEHSLCEFDKYERVRLGQGRPRQIFRAVK